MDLADLAYAVSYVAVALLVLLGGYLTVQVIDHFFWPY